MDNMTSLTNQEKKRILEQEIRRINSEMYPIEVRGRIAGKLNDMNLKNQCLSELERLQKYLDEYGLELKHLSPQPAKKGD